ncbi:MAG: GNAT family N-acetyltransferase [Acidimicrobiia bacterium]
MQIDLSQARWVHDIDTVDWQELSDLYRSAPLGDKPPERLRTVFGNSMFPCFVYLDGRLIGAGRAIADGLDCAYVADVAVHRDYQGNGVGAAIIRKLLDVTSGHKKVILYANPGTEGFYSALGFLPMTTAMAVWADPERAVAVGLARVVDR